jgi:hypothetical protein
MPRRATFALATAKAVVAVADVVTRAVETGGGRR